MQFFFIQQYQKTLIVKYFGLQSYFILPKFPALFTNFCDLFLTDEKFFETENLNLWRTYE